MKRVWDIDELIEYFTLMPDDMALMKDKSGFNKLSFSIILKIFQLEGRFPSNKDEIPESIIEFISKQLKINPQIFDKYILDSRLGRYHRRQIKEYYGFRQLTADDAEDITKWIYENVQCYDREKVSDALYTRLRELRFEPPTSDRIDRIVSSALRNYETTVFRDIAKIIPLKTKVLIDKYVKMFSENENKDTVEGSVSFNELRTDPGKVGLDSVFQEVKKLRMLKNLQIPLHLLDNIPQKVLKKYKQRVSSELLSEIRRHPDHVRYSLLTIFFWVRSREITDNLADLLISIIHKIQVRSERKVDREILNDVKKVSGKYNILRNLAEISLENPDKAIKDVVFPVYSKKLLEDLVKDLKMNDNSYRSKVYSLMKNSYSRHYRRMLPELFDTLEFRSDNEIHKPVLDALKIVRKFMNSNVRTILISSIPILSVIKPKWRRAVIQRDCNGNESVEKINYEICVLQSLREKLRCKEIWIEGADRYRNPEEDLPKDFENRREEYYEVLKKPTSSELFIENLKTDLSQALHSFNKSIINNPKVKLTTIKGGRITVSPSEPQSEPLNLTALKSGLMQEWPMVNLLDILKETDYLLNFTEHFKSAGVRESLDRETIRRRLIVSLFALGTNTGLKRIAKASEDNDSFDDLRYIKRKFINKDNVRNAIVSIVNGILKNRTISIWGEATSCASDSKKFGAWDQNLMTEWHIRYRGRGVMIYWHVEKNSTCIYSQLKSCSSSEVAAMMQGILKHCTEMDIDKNYVDAHGQSEVAFAFSHLLNFSLMPRFKNINRQKLYIPDLKSKESLINLVPVITRNIDWNCIREQYDQMIKYSIALKIGTAETESIMKRFTQNNPMHPTYKALKELGKVVKTIFLCEYLMSEDLRIEINEGLNVVENWNSANSFIFYGKSSEIQSNNLEDQEISVLCLHLLQNSLVFINTLMIQHILSKKEWQDRMSSEDLRALTPLIYQHVNPYGKFILDMNKRLLL